MHKHLVRYTHLVGHLVKCLALALIIIVGAERAQATDVPASFSLDGELFANTEGTAPLLDPTVEMKIQILDSDRTCILYEETQSINTVFSKGYFSVQVGTPTADAKRTTNDSGHTMATIYQNITTVSGKKLSDGTVCNIAAVGGTRRYVRITVSPASLGGTPRVLSPDLPIDSVPNAIIAERAESLQGLRGSDFLQINTASGSVLTQANLQSFFSSAGRFNALTAIVDGTSTNYMRTTTGGAQLPVFSGAPTSPAQGSVWFDTSDQKMKYRTSSTTEILGSGAGSVSSVALTAPSELSVAGGPITTSGTLAMTWANQTTGKVFAAPNGSTGTPTFRALVAADVPALPYLGSTATASGDLSGSYPGPTVAKIQGAAVAVTAPTDGQILKYIGAATNAWTPTNFSIGDLKTAAGAQQFAGSASCAATQTLTWSSLTNTMTCSNIAGLNASVITAGTIDAARLPASLNPWTVTGSDVYRASGKVGIGTTTPLLELDIVDGALGVRSGTMQPQMSIWAQNANTHAGQFNFQASRTNGTAYPQTNDILGVVTFGNVTNHSARIYGAASEAQSSSAAGGHLSFHTTPVTTITPTERMRIDQNGNVGIGTTNPGLPLHVKGTAAFESASVDSVGSNFSLWKSRGYAAVVNNDEIGYLSNWAHDGTGLRRSSYILTSVDGAVATNSVPGRIQFATTNVGAADATVKMSILSSGNVGVGAATPLDTLSIGTAPVASATRSLVNLSNTALVGGSGNGTYVGANPTTNTGDFVNLQVADASKFKVEGSGNVTAAGTVLATGGLKSGSFKFVTSTASKFADCGAGWAALSAGFNCGGERSSHVCPVTTSTGTTCDGALGTSRYFYVNCDGTTPAKIFVTCVVP